MNHRPCPVCGALHVDFLHEMKFQLPDSSPLPRHYQVVCCLECGMVFADSPATQQSYDLYYEQFSKYEDTKLASGGGYTPQDRERLDAMAAMISGYLKPEDSILDIGCANGGLLEALSRCGQKVLAGVDPSPGSVRQVQQRGFAGFNLKISEMSVKTVGTYQAIVMSHVLEHVFDVASSMKIVHSLLPEGGVLFLEVPDAARYETHYVVPYYYFDPEHINHFNAALLETLASIHGFKVLTVRHYALYPSPLFDYPVVNVVLQKISAGDPVRVTFHPELAGKVRAFVDKSKRDGSLKKIETFAESGKPVIIWGAGSYTQRLLGGSRLSECNIVAIVDNDIRKQGLEMGRFTIEHPEVLYQKQGVVLISAAVHAGEIKKEIAAMGVHHSVEILGEA